MPHCLCFYCVLCRAVPKTAQNAQLAIEESTVDDSMSTTTAADSTAPPSDLVTVAVDAAGGVQAPRVWTGLPYVSQTTPSFKASDALVSVNCA
jgi:hypothetical protein